MSIILGGKQLEVPGIKTVSWLDDPKRVPRTPKVTPRSHWIRSIFLHTTRGMVCHRLEMGASQKSTAWAEARYQVSSTRDASFDCVIGQDGVALWQNDPLDAFSWHATQVNSYSLGIEMCQDSDGGMYGDTIHSACVLVSFLCEQLGIQKQTAWDHDGPDPRRIKRCDPGAGGSNLVGAYGHRNVWQRSGEGFKAERGPGDPGGDVFQELVGTHGFERFDVGSEEDLAVWRDRQGALGVEPDGVPGPKTVEALRAAGYRNGLWVDRLSLGSSA